MSFLIFPCFDLQNLVYPDNKLNRGLRSWAEIETPVYCDHHKLYTNNESRVPNDRQVDTDIELTGCTLSPKSSMSTLSTTFGQSFF